MGKPEIAVNALELIGNTPLIQLQKLPGKNSAAVFAKAEFMNPGGSIKDRICLAMIEEAEKKGLLKPGGTIIEPTSGNTGIGLALVAAVKGYKLILAMPETMSVERRKLLAAYGAEFILTPGIEGMIGAVKRAKEIAESNPNYYMPLQFSNPVNPEIHRLTTAKEIITQTKGNIDAFVAAVGTGGTLTGVGEALRKEIPRAVRIVAVEPANSPVLSGGRPGPHKIQGIGAGFVPDVLKRKIIDEIIQVKDEDAFATASRLAKEEGLLVGISSGANVFAALQIADNLGRNKTVVTVLCDAGERYLSMW
jgi:cysteine synthase A